MGERGCLFSLSMSILKPTVVSNYEDMRRRHNIEVKGEECGISMEVCWGEPEQETLGVIFRAA